MDMGAWMVHQGDWKVLGIFARSIAKAPYVRYAMSASFQSPSFIKPLYSRQRNANQVLGYVCS